MKDQRQMAGANGGFSLVELMVVIAIIGLIMVAVIPRTSVMHSADLKATARALAGTIRLTYATAAMNRKIYRIEFNLEDQFFQVQEQAGDTFVPAADPLLSERSLPDSVEIRRTEIMGRECYGLCRDFLYFTPGGYVEGAGIYLGTVDDDQSTISIFTRPMTGRAVIVLEDISRAEWEASEEYQ